MVGRGNSTCPHANEKWLLDLESPPCTALFPVIITNTCRFGCRREAAYGDRFHLLSCSHGTVRAVLGSEISSCCLQPTGESCVRGLSFGSPPRTLQAISSAMDLEEEEEDDDAAAASEASRLISGIRADSLGWMSPTRCHAGSTEPLFLLFLIIHL
ncbi:hypothetical protein MUK42_35029 [Musa troglodytarum]|uniref:Uncharacterized protein n=1 Tax=Musa troglodytarum TaxID=320322 RepID=A0A9E7HFZ5_9LILI|nr:hypothetical protein MUK42_35029 [Musa troglodytarum]